MFRAPLTLALTAAAAVLALAGCSTSGGTDAEGDPDASASDGATEPDAVVDPTDPACLVGDWRITQAEMQGFYDAVTAQTDGGGVEFTILGDTGLSFTTDQYEYTPSFTLELLFADVSGQSVTTGSIGGGWTADAGIITTTLGFNNLATQVTIDGTPVESDELIAGIIASDPINAVPFDCSDPGAPVLQFDTGSGARTPVALTPAA